MEKLSGTATVGRPWRQFARRMAGVLMATCLLGGAALLGWTPRQALGQQGRYSEANLLRFGTRYVLPRLSDPEGRASTAVLRLAMNGWRRSHLLVVELAEATGCPVGVTAPRIKAVHCLRDLGQMASTSVTLTQAGGALETIVVYSVNAAAVPDACQAFDPVRSGAMNLAEWETRVWFAQPGDPFAVVEEATEGDLMTLLPGRPMLPITVTSNASGQSAGGSQTTTALPLVKGTVSRAWFISQLAGCAQGRTRLVAETATGACPSPDQRTFTVGSMGAAGLVVPGEGVFGATTVLTDGVVAVADMKDRFTWRTFGGHVANAAESQGQLTFPMGLSPITKTRSTLWVANLHPTATAQIDVLMWDGNQKLKLFRDDTPLCAGSSRHYDVAAIAGSVDTTRQRGGLPPMGPMLSMRVESSNRALPLAPPIAGAVLLEGLDGDGGYTGLTVPPEVPLLHQRAQRNFGMNFTTVVPNVKINDGVPLASTVLAVQNVVNPAANALTLDLYDESGQRLVLRVDIGLSGGLTGAQFIDLGALAGRRLGEQGRYTVPQHFRGTAVLRGQQNVGMLGVVAVDVPADAGRPPSSVDRAGPDGSDKAYRDVVGVFTGQMLPRWPDARTPSPTPSRTRVPLTRTPTATRTATSTATPRPPTATVTPRPTATPRPGKLWLPRLEGAGPGE